MSAEELGKRLLGEVEHCTLDKMILRLSALRQAKSQKPLFNIPPLDALIAPPSLQEPTPALAATAYNDLLGSSPPTEIQVRSPQKKLNLPKPQIIEITGTKAGAGKTHLLYYIITLALLDSHFHTTPLHGLSRTVVYIDTDARFSILRLAQIIQTHILTCHSQHPHPPSPSNPDSPTTSTNPPSTDEILHITRKALTHLHIFHPSNLASTLATLSSLPTYLLSLPAHHSRPRALHSIILDSATAFLWPVRAAEEIARLTQQPNPAAHTSSHGSYATLKTQLEYLATRFHCLIFQTTWSYATQDGREGPRSMMPGHWTQWATKRLVVGRRQIPPFAVGWSVEQAKGDREMRGRVVERGVFDVKKIGSGRGFAFRIVGEGVRMGDGSEGNMDET